MDERYQGGAPYYQICVPSITTKKYNIIKRQITMSVGSITTFPVRVERYRYPDITMNVRPSMSVADFLIAVAHGRDPATKIDYFGLERRVYAHRVLKDLQGHMKRPSPVMDWNGQMNGNYLFTRAGVAVHKTLTDAGRVTLGDLGITGFDASFEEKAGDPKPGIPLDDVIKIGIS
jgi:hypothetical protein